MKIILSRKGFDSSNGGQPNPIMPDGTLLSLPIPDPDGNNKFSDLRWNDENYYNIIHSLRPRTTLRSENTCHLDPDLRKNVKDRLPGWKPAFGQSGSALTHLCNQGVTIGDLFLFFGWFKATEEIDGKLKYKKGTRDQHIIFGYMQIGSVIEDKTKVPDWLKEHPHVGDRKVRDEKSNFIFLPSDNLSIMSGYKGCSVLDYRCDRVLTKDGKSRRFWDLPSFFKNIEISHHPNPWKDDCFVSAAIGQEFVMEANPDLIEWVKQIIKE
jgi:hypothetical protein